MVKRNKIYFGFVGIATLVTVLFFQNCSKVAFDTSLSSQSPIVDGAGLDPVDVDPGYSEKCDDYASKGWASKEECLTDGRWHPIDPADPDMERHVFAGADVKVIIPQQSLFSNGSNLGLGMSGNEECQQVYRSQNGSRPFYCLSATRFQGEAAAETSQGSARYGSDGSIFCNGLNNPGTNGCGGLDRMTFKWYIRY